MTRFEPGDKVSFASGTEFRVAEVEEIRRGHDGDHLLVVREGQHGSGSQYVVLSSYAEKIAAGEVWFLN